MGALVCVEGDAVSVTKRPSGSGVSIGKCVGNIARKYLFSNKAIQRVGDQIDITGGPTVFTSLTDIGALKVTYGKQASARIGDAWLSADGNFGGFFVASSSNIEDT